MDLRFTADEIAFRDEVRDFMRTSLPPSIRRKMVEGRRLEKDDIVRWQRILNEKGWAVPHWPAEWGGQNWTPVQQYIFQDELQQAPAPAPLPFGVAMVGPVIVAFGSEAQKRRFLPRIANLDDWWCQGFSEPGAGSDLASLKTAAKREGDHYIVNGQKIWTTMAQYADWIFCLVRTDSQGKKQEGITFLLIDMKTKGITVRPIVTIDGGAEVNEVFFDDVQVPVENRIGAENKGWDYAKFLLGNERTGIARVGYSKERIRRIRELASMTRDGGRPIIEDERFREKLAALEIELKALEMTQLRVVAAERNRDREKARSLFLDPQDQGRGNTTGGLGAAARDRRPLCAALCAGNRGRQRAAGRTRLGGTDRADLFQLAQDLDLWRLERDPEEHHRQGDPGALSAMDFDLSQEQSLLKDSVGRLMADHYAFEKRKNFVASPDGFSREMWRRYAELGLLGLPFAEAEGGFGGGAVETMIVMEAMGRALAVEPYLASVVLAGGALRHGASERQRAGLVPAIARGETILAFAHAEREARYDLAYVQAAARRDGAAWVLDGEKTLVLHGEAADRLVVSARVGGASRDPDGIALFLVDGQAPGVSRRAYPTQDSSARRR